MEPEIDAVGILLHSFYGCRRNVTESAKQRMIVKLQLCRHDHAPLLFKEWRQIAATVNNALDINHIIREAKEDHITAHHGQTSV